VKDADGVSWYVCQVLAAMPAGGVAFYNCGEHSGRSQPHKHVQVGASPTSTFSSIQFRPGSGQSPRQCCRCFATRLVLLGLLCKSQFRSLVSVDVFSLVGAGEFVENLNLWLLLTCCCSSGLHFVLICAITTPHMEVAANNNS